MTGLSKITDRILAEAKADAEQILKNARREADAVSKKYAAEAEKMKKDASEENRREMEGMVTRARSSVAMEARNARLLAESELIDEAFARAYAQVRDADDEARLSFTASLLLTLLSAAESDEKTGRELYGEDAEATGLYTVLLNEADKNAFGSRLIQTVQNRLIGKEVPAILSRVSVGEETAKIDGGLLLRTGDIEVNSSLEMMFASIRPKIEAKVSKALFG